MCTNYHAFVSAEAEYQSLKAGITAGTVLAVLIPIVIALGCFIAHLKQERDERYYDEYE